MTAVTPTLTWLMFLTAGYVVEPDGHGVTDGSLPGAENWNNLAWAQPAPAMPNPFVIKATWFVLVAAGTTGSVGGDTNPVGHLVFTIAPTTGVLMSDYEEDGSGSWGHVGNGQLVCNWSGQGDGSVRLAFMSKGSFALTAKFVTADANYNSAELATPVNIEVK